MLPYGHMNSELTQFVREALIQGESRGAIAAALKSAGWSADEVRDALDLYADAAFAVPVPRRKPYLSAREAFLYLVMFLTLYISAISFGTVIFQNINLWLPDPLELQYSGFYDSIIDAIRWSTSSLLVAYPVFMYITYVLNKAMAKDAAKRGSKIRKWLTYVTLLVAAGVIIGDTITLVFNFLGGELTLRFILKVITVAAIAGAIFGYYLWDLRKEEKEA